MSTPYMQTRYVLDAHSGAVSGPVRVSYFDPRTGEPCATKPEPLHGDQERRGREREGYRESLERGRKKRAVVVDGVLYESISAAAGAIGCDKGGLGAKLRAGGSSHIGHSVGFADSPASAAWSPVRNARPVRVDGEVYESMSQAARAVGVTPSSMWKALRAGGGMCKGCEVSYV